jgi:cyclic pyranopterin phosphate synthase
MPEEGIPKREKAVFMTSEEVIDIAKTFVDIGIKKIRLTGGEPLIKKDIDHIILELGKLPIELTMTTNAILVDRHIETFKKAGIKSINVSLDSLKEERFNAISRRSYFNKIVENINLLIDEGFKVKVNCVLIKGTNEDEISDFIRWSISDNIHIRFIEFMPFDGNNWNWDKTVSLKEVLAIADKDFSYAKIEDAKNDTTKNYQVEGGKGTFGIISTVTNPFCDTCNRIRLTADGKIKNCLFSQSENDLLSAHRKKRDLKEIIENAVMSKHKKLGGFDSFDEEYIKESKNRSMISIGG